MKLLNVPLVPSCKTSSFWLKMTGSIPASNRRDMDLMCEEMCEHLSEKKKIFT